MRLFTAIQFTGQIKDRLCDAVSRLKQSAVRGNFTRRENLHLTLVFIGETAEAARVKKIKTAMDAVRAESFLLRIGGLGEFQRDGGDIYWAGVSRSEELQSVYSQLYVSLAADGFVLESRDYKPHLTLGRNVVPTDGFDKNEIEEILAEQSMAVDTIHLMKSERIDGKLTYTSIYRKELNR